MKFTLKELRIDGGISMEVSGSTWIKPNAGLTIEVQSGEGVTKKEIEEAFIKYASIVYEEIERQIQEAIGK